MLIRCHFEPKTVSIWSMAVVEFDEIVPAAHSTCVDAVIVNWTRSAFALALPVTLHLDEATSVDVAKFDANEATFVAITVEMVHDIVDLFRVVGDLPLAVVACKQMVSALAEQHVVVIRSLDVNEAFDGSFVDRTDDFDVAILAPIDVDLATASHYLDYMTQLH